MIYAIGDIHGKITMLRQLLAEIVAQPLQEDDTVVFLGDYVDRGEDSRAVIDEVIRFKAEQHANTVFLRGNHEQLMLDSREDDPPRPAPRNGFILFEEKTLNWLQNGGVDTLLSYGLEDYSAWVDSIPAAHWKFLEDTRFEHLIPGYHFVHAGLLPPNVSWDMGGWGLDPRLWIREEFLNSAADFDGRIVVFGHTPQRTGKPLVQPNKLGIDTGAVFGGPLTCAILEPTSAPVPANTRFLQIPNPDKV